MSQLIGPSFLAEKTTTHSLSERQISDEALEEALQAEKRNLELVRHFVKETNESMDNMMIFAGLFSAAITQFISSTSTGLKSDSSDLTNQLLNASLTLQKYPDAPLPNFSDPSTFEPSNTIITVNALLFFSLILSLLSALGAMVVKQWVRRYGGHGATSTVVWKRGRQHTEARLKMELWHLSQFIAYIPYALHVALAIFLVGVLMWVYTLNAGAMIPSTILVGLASFAYALLMMASSLPNGERTTARGSFSRWCLFRGARQDEDADVEKNLSSTLAPHKPAPPKPIRFILNPPTDLKPSSQQHRPPVHTITDAIMWINAIRDNEGHDQISRAFNSLRAADWAQVDLGDLLTKNGNLILTRCNSIASLLWKQDSHHSYLVSGARGQARALCFFIEWFYHQLSVDQRRSLEWWPEAGIAKALMHDPFKGKQPPSNYRGEMTTVDDITLASSVIAKLNHVQLAKGAICEMCITKTERDDQDVRVRIPAARDPHVYEEDDPPHTRFPWKWRMQELASVCVSSDADCLLHYAGDLQTAEGKEKIAASYTTLTRCIWAHNGTVSRHTSYVSLRKMLETLGGQLEDKDARREWFDVLYKVADRTFPQTR